MKWVVNKDEALVFEADGRRAGGVWRGAWRVGRDIVYGFLGAVWDPYERLGRFDTVREAKDAVEKKWRERDASSED